MQVAPDHPEVKNVVSTFQRVAMDGRVVFRGNIAFGTDLTLDDLRSYATAMDVCVCGGVWV